MSDNRVTCPNQPCENERMTLMSETDVPDKSGTFILYECPACGRKAGLVFQAQEGLTQHASGWIEQELKANGFVFPSDFSNTDRRQW